MKYTESEIRNAVDSLLAARTAKKAAEAAEITALKVVKAALETRDAIYGELAIASKQMATLRSRLDPKAFESEVKRLLPPEQYEAAKAASMTEEGTQVRVICIPRTNPTGPTE